MHALPDANGLPLIVDTSAANPRDSRALKPTVTALRTKTHPHRDGHFEP